MASDDDDDALNGGGRPTSSLGFQERAARRRAEASQRAIERELAFSEASSEEWSKRERLAKERWANLDPGRDHQVLEARIAEDKAAKEVASCEDALTAATAAVKAFLRENVLRALLHGFGVRSAQLEALRLEEIKAFDHREKALAELQSSATVLQGVVVEVARRNEPERERCRQLWEEALTKGSLAKRKNMRIGVGEKRLARRPR